MNRLMTCILVELRKLFRSRIPIITMLAFTMVPFMGGFFMFVLKNPELAESLGFISTKAHIVGSADWKSYLELLSQAIAIGGLLVFGFITSWIFGREYSDRTIKDLLALPISRNFIVLAKFTVAAIWCFLLSVYVLLSSLLVGVLIDIPGASYDVVLQGILVFMLCSTLTILLSTPVGLFASIGRGYLSPLGFVIFTLVFAQIIAATGYGRYFPWAVPAITGGIAKEFGVLVEGISIIIVLVTSILGLVATMLWWRFADQD